MKSHINKRFRKHFEKLPKEVKAQAKKAYNLFKNDPYHSSLHFKEVNSDEQLYSVRINEGYRALGFREGDDLFWFWVGTHSEYDTLLR